MSLDLDQVRTFVTAAESRHFGRAATQLHLTQQGVSRRIAALERRLGVELFCRRPGGIELSAEGDRFLTHARRLLDLAAAAIESVDPDAHRRALRVDVWGPACRPLRWLRAHAARTDLPVEVSMRRDSDAALEALVRGEIDVAFICSATLPPDATDLDSEVAGCEPLAAGIARGHPLAHRDVVSAADLRDHRLWWPVSDALDVSRQVADYAALHGITIDSDGHSMGIEFVLDALVDHPDRIALYGAEWPLEPAEPVRLVPIEEPGPHLAWSVVWHGERPHPELDRLRRSLRIQHGRPDTCT